MTFNDVKVLAGDDSNPAAYSSLKNLVWENLPVPDILLHIDTPNIVSLENKINIYTGCPKKRVISVQSSF